MGSIFPPKYLYFIVLSIYLSIYCYCSYIYQFVHLSIYHLYYYPPNYLSIFPFIFLYFICPSIYMFVRLSINIFIYLPIYLSVCPTVYQSIYMFFHVHIAIYLSTCPPHYQPMYPTIWKAWIFELLQN